MRFFIFSLLNSLICFCGIILSSSWKPDSGRESKGAEFTPSLSLCAAVIPLKQGAQLAARQCYSGSKPNCLPLCHFRPVGLVGYARPLSLCLWRKWSRHTPLPPYRSVLTSPLWGPTRLCRVQHGPDALLFSISMPGTPEPFIYGFWGVFIWPITERQF